MFRTQPIVLTVIAALSLAACQTAQQHAEAVNQANEAGDKVTVGKVQREIRVGMTSAEVVEVLGSPNMVTTDDKRRESWVYDKIATQTAYSTSSGGVSALVLGGGLVGAGVLGGLAGANTSASSGAQSTSQRTLTIIIKYDENNRVRDFSYRSSSF